MDRDETGGCASAEQPCRALVVIETHDARDEPAGRVSGGRPMAPFLTQLMLHADPALRTARLERTRTAAALYARIAGTAA